MAHPTLQRHCLTLSSNPGSADQGSAWAREVAANVGLSEERIAALDTCITELVSNVVDHSYRGRTGEIRLELDLGPPGVAILTIVDEGPEFDPLSVPPPAVPKSLEEAEVGGLGIQLVRSYADACEYKRSEGRNVFIAFFGTRG